MTKMFSVLKTQVFHHGKITSNRQTESKRDLFEQERKQTRGKPET